MDIKEMISKVMKQAVDHCEVMGVNIWGEFAAKQVFFGIVNHTYCGILWECTGLIV